MKKLLYTIIVFTTLTACKKSAAPKPDNPYGLPNATQTGANIFACRINDSNWIAGQNPYLQGIGTSFDKSNVRDTLGISAGAANNILFSDIGFEINSMIQGGMTYRLNDTTKAFARTLSLFATCGPTTGYGGQWNYAVDGYITITKFTGTYIVPNCCSHGNYDPSAIISGTFNFIIAVPNCDTIKVTDGRFDINYSQY